ncbi:ABC transporter ATP-binding protein [Longirhabdus pacifica]|uniref:ABC transporter ATP-binding protein n=1 Tax=Longirhabdus pacifica TaxID=2305227 RepID=UPI0013E8CBB6|nr:ABC transporter ATP-binding protein [Longirhabdus pacifica]
MINTKDLRICYDKQVVVEGLNVCIPIGEITALVGSNGSGKSTILKTLSRLMKPSHGHIYIDGKLLHKQSTKQIAKQLAILPQNPTAPQGLTVYELVSFGRFPHQKGMSSLSAKDKEMIFWALEVTGIIEFADRPIEALSGGQRQKAWIAMALVQETKIIFLDEPTTFLDMGHQIEVMNLLQKLNEEEDRTIVMVVHDLNHASRYAHHMVAIKKGQVINTGTPSEVMTSSLLRSVFGIEADIIVDPRSGKPLCLPYALCDANEVQQNHLQVV